MLKLKPVRILKSTYLLLMLIGLFAACTKSTPDVVKPQPEPEPEPPVNPQEIVYSSEYKYNLNVVYFVPNNVTPNPQYEERISGILINGQAFFAKWMQHWGFGNKTFGLLKNAENTRVKIHLVRGPENADKYTSRVNIEPLVNQYFADNPGAKTSDHFLILSVTNKRIDANEEIGHEVPYYASGRYGYAIDYPGLKQESLGTGGLVGEKATVHIGGMLHEMGHAINLPHNGPTKSQSTDPNFGMTLMGSGNYTYGKSPTFLSFFDAATLNNCQVFSKVTGSFYTPVTVKVTSINTKVEAGNIEVSGTYTSTNPVKHITFRNVLDNDDQGYRSVTFTTLPGAGNTFSVKMPIAEFISKGNTSYSLNIVFHNENGNLTSAVYGYKFVNDVPVLDFGDRPMLARNGWEVISVSSVQAGYPASTMLDGNDNTYWHTSWTDPKPHPHHVTVKTGAAAVTAQGLSYLTRHDNFGNGGKIKEFKIEVSSDGNTWTEVFSGVGALNGRQYFPFNGPKTFQYFKLTTKNDYEGKTHATIAEINLY